MALLIAGNTEILNQTNPGDYFLNEDVVVLQKTSAPKQKNTRKVAYEPEPDDYEVMNEFFRIHDFSKVFYLSMLMDPLSNGSTASLNLFSVLSCAYQNHVSQFYVCLPDQHTENSEKRILAGQNMLAALSVFNQTEEMKVRLVYVPYLLNKADPVTIDLSGRKGRLFRISVEE